MTDGTFSVALAMAGAVGAALVLITMYTSRRVNLSFWTTGSLVGGLLACSIIYFSAHKHLSFDDIGSGGVVYLQNLDTSISDIQCPGGMLLVRGELASKRPREFDSAAHFRCPTGIVLNKFSSRPFLPWPEYSDGSSLALKSELAALMDGN